MPKISIITINLNNRAGLEKTINSVLNQTFTNFEYIIIDGNSIDGSRDILLSVSNKLAYWISEPDLGIYNAMNKGIIRSEGEYLLFLNSGDCFHNNEVLEKIFTNDQGSFDIITGDLYQIYPNGKKIYSEMPERITAKYLYNNFLSHPSTFIKKAVFLKHGLFDESYKIAGDHAFFVKIFFMDSINYCHKKIVISDYTMDGISSNSTLIDTINKERIRALKDQLPTEYYNLVTKHCKQNQLTNLFFRVKNKFRQLTQKFDQQ